MRGPPGPEAPPHSLRTCGCAHRYQHGHQQAYHHGYQPPNGNGRTGLRGRSQSATPLGSPAWSVDSRASSRPSTPTSVAQSSCLTGDSRSRSEPFLADDGNRSGRSSRSRSTHWSRRSPEDLARLARLRSPSRSPVAMQAAMLQQQQQPGPRAARHAVRPASVGTGYGHSYSLPRPFDTTPTGAGRPGRASTIIRPEPRFERSRTPSQSGASYYRGRAVATGCTSRCRLTTRTMSELSLASNHLSEDHQPRFISEVRMEPRCVLTSFRSTVLRRRDSTWSRFVEEVQLQKCLVSVRPRSPSPARSPCAARPVSPAAPASAAPASPAFPAATASPAASPAPPASPRRYRAELEVWIGPGGQGQVRGQPATHTATVIQAAA